MGDQAAENLRQNDNTEQTRFTLPPSNSKLFNLFRGLSGLGLKGNIRKGETSLDFESIIATSWHRTNNCYRFRRLLNYLVKKGYLREYIEEEASNSSQPLPHTSSRPVMDVILVGPTSSKSRGQSRLGIFVVGVNYSFTLSSIRPIDDLDTFSESPLRQLFMPHYDALVLTLEVEQHLKKQILVVLDNNAPNYALVIYVMFRG